ncbi:MULTISPECIES: helix-turn-helix domain-containing protein [unclassified Streptomyces]|uniref:helix-turn-helix domain-containing protein n=1 Tax=unclassified Streptomyces TaxID=2593676 RepID=UPI001BE7397F|nr:MULTISPECIES: helix-turn-helix transcriptional regulator [unclassified Streptomyces]MBT2407678.1 helix-turn-helix domain-containing protein [Streptomyces sp. ISL-21]MBT2611640.1 helix-turn-helix domain-containing protein [Streptomyces sp. ISL-87]
MDTPTALGDFLRNRRDRLTPQDVGLPTHGTTRRRVPGLRREELALLAGVSITYYTHLEQGHSVNASDAVLDSLARALRLTPDEHAHLRDLARPPRAARRAAAPRPEYARAATRQLLAAMPEVPAVVLDRRNDVLAWNPLGHALLAGHLDATSPERPADRPNLTRMLFLDPHTRELHADWKQDARTALAALRLVAGRHPDDRALAELIGSLMVQSPEFAALWSKHPVRDCTVGVKHLRHPVVGELALDFESMPLSDGLGHRVLFYSAAPESASAAGLTLLGTTLAVDGAERRPGAGVDARVWS